MWFENKKEVIDFFSNLINSIDIKCEKIIYYFKNKKQKNEIYQILNFLIKQIKRIENFNLKNIDLNINEKRFAFFIFKNPRSKSIEFEFNKDIGSLVLLNEFVNENIQHSLR